MKKRVFIVFLGIALLTQSSVKAQWAVIDPTNLVQNVLTAVRTASTASSMIDNFKEVKKVYDQGKEFYDELKSVKNLIKDAKKVQKTLLMMGEITDIYIGGYQKMMADPNFTVEELVGIAEGYAILLEEAGIVLNDLKEVVNINGLSLNDKERMDVVDKAYQRIFEYRNLVRYYTNKTIGVSYIRAKKKNETNQVLQLYGNPNDKYW